MGMCHLKLQILYRILCALDEINCGTNDAIAFNIIYHTQISVYLHLTCWQDLWKLGIRGLFLSQLIVFQLNLRYNDYGNSLKTSVFAIASIDTVSKLYIPINARNFIPERIYVKISCRAWMTWRRYKIEIYYLMYYMSIEWHIDGIGTESISISTSRFLLLVVWLFLGVLTERYT